MLSRRMVAVTILMAFLLTATAPQAAHAGCLKAIVAFTLLGAGIWALETAAAGNSDKLGEATLIGAGLGLVGGLIICAVMSSPSGSAKLPTDAAGCQQDAKASDCGCASFVQAYESNAFPGNGDRRQSLPLLSLRVAF